MDLFSKIIKPTLLLDRDKAVRNLDRMLSKADTQKIRFRPHFKTHQSTEIGEWFRSAGVNAITVSSVEMAQYFAAAGWDDITIAFPANLRQMDEIRTLSRQVKLSLLVESVEAVEKLGNELAAEPGVDIWIKVDAGAGRTGVGWDAAAELKQVAEAVERFSGLRLRGLLTHAGHTYKVRGKTEICRTYHESVDRMNAARRSLADHGLVNLEISVGDTPASTLCDDPGEVDEIRPGNFIFYDVQQYLAGVCRAEDIAVALACPVVAKHPERSEIVVYGGAIHLSKDYALVDGVPAYGLVCLPENTGWGAPLPGAFVRGLSQEHGVIRLRPDDLDKIQIGGLVCVLPAHSCLTVQLMRSYLTLEGQRIHTLN
jgi:D-serine deaminase-like pyridoxal phosphate-dependent protein